jgi:hypothetical protein
MLSYPLYDKIIEREIEIEIEMMMGDMMYIIRYYDNSDGDW